MKTNTLDFDAQALREKILDLAMRGKLVPQDPNDEPASVLLEKIKAEKEELVKEKKIKKSKPLPEITDDEKPFEIPDSWEWVRLGEILKPEVHQKPDRNFTYIDIASVNNVTNKVTNPTKVNIKQDKIASRARQVLDDNDILFSVVRPYLKNIAMVPNTLEYKIGSTGFYVLKPYELIERKYIFYLVLSKYVVQGMTMKMKGDNSPSIRKGDLQNFIIPLPPLSEQSRIAAKIAQLFALLRKVESSIQQYANLKDLLKSKLLDLAMRGKLVDQDPNDEPANVLLDKIKAEKDQLVKEKKIKKIKSLPEITDDEKPFDIPDSWEWVRLGDVLDVRDGTHDTPKYVSEGVPLITAKNLRNGEIDFSNIKYISENDAIKINERSQVSEGDVLFAMIGTIGNPVLVRTRNNFSIKNVALLKQIAFLNMNFVCQYILGSTKLLMKNASGGNQKFISLKKINKLPFPLPPLSEQSRIVSKLEQLFTLIG
ncbi:restriction endonuclease subunit S [Limosilactobacillus reuteri]|uniref:restriction endonuclease subunit S n=2 Tax=Limosilactobacillus reuteri TaxID=1598 RepID=UPI00143DDD39|nr:restriction endonuclease subunit S [Limosilactobacillus reuteri]QIZ03725.1 restriction endonuclease subunit S [Limosilactobacillus reuteri]